MEGHSTSSSINVNTNVRPFCINNFFHKQQLHSNINNEGQSTTEITNNRKTNADFGDLKCIIIDFLPYCEQLSYSDLAKTASTTTVTAAPKHLKNTTTSATWTISGKI